MGKLIMLVGLPASGKSTFTKSLAKEKNAVIHSSDELRKELFGSYEEQTKNDVLFEELHRRIKLDLEKGKVVVYDATNICRKRRAYFVSQLKEPTIKEVIVVATDIQKCLTRDYNRKKKVGSDVILRMWKSFEFPLWSEGWDDIQIYYTHDGIDTKHWFKCADIFNQDNHNHSLTLGEHMGTAAEKYIESCDFWHNQAVYDALRLHDIGKLWTKDFRTSKQEPSDDAHYFNHHCVSAYQAMFIYTPQSYYELYNEDYIYVIQLINYHMQPYFTKSEKSRKKWLDIFGEEMYNDLMILNKYDRLAH